jgi:drug/metabolite transporter (DMT)-like permease
MLPVPSHFLRAVVYALLAILLFDLQGVIIKFMGDRYPVQQLASFRNGFGLISAYQLAKPASLSPYEYFGIPFVFILGWTFFDESPFDKLTPGVFLIVAGGMLIAWRERKKRVDSVLTE